MPRLPPRRARQRPLLSLLRAPDENLSMADWRPYQPCCFTAALNPDSGFCTECGRPLFRCVAFDQCKGLINPLGFCPVCLQPRLAGFPAAARQCAQGRRWLLEAFRVSIFAQELGTAERVSTRRLEDKLEEVEKAVCA